MSVIDNYTILNDSNGHNGTCAIVLPGRGSAGLELGYPYAHKSGLDDTLIVAVTAKNYEWYPQPHGPNNQLNAIAGLREAVESIRVLIMEIESKYNIHSEQMFLIGFSAGGVVAMETAYRIDKQVGAVVVHSGAIFEPEKVPYAKTPDMHVVWTHSKNDPVFKWDERYIPARTALKKKGYRLSVLEQDDGGHTVKNKEIVSVGRFLKKKFYPDKQLKGISSIVLPQ